MTHTIYKEILEKQFKRTGGGLGDSCFFEGWINNINEKYNIIPD